MSTYTGTLLRVDLGSNTVRTEEISEETKKRFIGGRGFGIYYLHKEVRAATEPLAPENTLYLLTGPLCGTKGQGFSKWVAICKSPLTGAVARAVGGGDFGAYLKFSGYDLIAIEGKAREPVYVHISDGGVRIAGAEDLWGLDTQETQEMLQKRHGKKTSVACIGPAGEKLVRYAVIMNDRRTASRCGVGTVMGSKRLKAIAINAAGEVEPSDPEAFRDLVRKQVEFLKASKVSKNIRKIGSLFPLRTFYDMGFFPVRNFRKGRIEGFENMVPEEYEKLKVGQEGCYSCMTRCGQRFRVSQGAYEGAYSEGPEYETVFAFGGLAGNTDIGAIIAADSLCDRLGIDTISCGSSIAFAMELFERGIITQKDTDGLELSWGNHASMLTLIKRIGEREGFGWILGEGTKRAAQQIGRGAEQYAMHVKGLEISGYEPRAIKGFGLNYATANMGAHHMYGYHRPETWPATQPGAMDPLADEGKGVSVAAAQKECAVNDSIVVCNFGNPGLPAQLRSDLLLAATGIREFGNIDHLTKVGERIVTLERCFNTREGFSRRNDELPKRMLMEPLEDAGPATGQTVLNLEGLLDEYYDAMGYDREGIPTKERLGQLGLTQEE